MIKDRNIKLSLIKYFIKKCWYPQMEVDILSKQRISKSRKLITDVDVLGLYTDVTGNLKPILGDCKTLKGQSPIARTLWMKGLMEYFGADKGIIILSKDIEKEHQLTSSYLNIQLLSDKDFDLYSKHTSDNSTDLLSALTSGDNWDSYFEIQKKFAGLKIMQDFAKTSFWNESSESSKLRSGIYIIKQSRAELNPANNLHLAITLNHFSLIAIALNEIITKIFNRYLVPATKEELDRDLKVIIYGGIENYEFLNDLRKKFMGTAVEERNLELPEWNVFLEYIRLTLENPLSANKLPLLLKEVAFCCISPEKKYNYAKSIVKGDQYVSNQALKLCSYLCKAGNLPPEFDEIFSSAFMELSI